VTELPDEASSILYNFSNQTLQNNFDPNNFPIIQKSRVILEVVITQIRNILRVAFYDHPDRRKPKFQISEPTIFNSNYTSTSLQITSNIIGLRYSREEEIDQQTLYNQDPEVTAEEQLKRHLNNYNNFN
jgi:hypothetical protein